MAVKEKKKRPSESRVKKIKLNDHLASSELNEMKRVSSLAYDVEIITLKFLLDKAVDTKGRAVIARFCWRL